MKESISKKIDLAYRWTKNAILNVIAMYSQHETAIEAIARKHGEINVTMRKTRAPSLDVNCDNSMGRGDRGCIFQWSKRYGKLSSPGSDFTLLT